MIAEEPVALSPVRVGYEQRIDHVRRVLARVDDAEIGPEPLVLWLRGTLNLGVVHEPTLRKTQSWKRGHVEGEAALFILEPLAGAGWNGGVPSGSISSASMNVTAFRTCCLAIRGYSNIRIRKPSIQGDVKSSRRPARPRARFEVHPLHHVEPAIDQHVERVRQQYRTRAVRRRLPDRIVNGGRTPPDRSDPVPPLVAVLVLVPLRDARRGARLRLREIFQIEVLRRFVRAQRIQAHDLDFDRRIELTEFEVNPALEVLEVRIGQQRGVGGADRGRAPPREEPAMTIKLVLEIELLAWIPLFLDVLDDGLACILERH